jgi:hypothetical protein
MRASDLKEAQGIVEAISSIDTQLKYQLAASNQQLTVEHAPRSNTYMLMSRSVAEAALELQREYLRRRRACLVRRANQLGLILEK